MNTERVELAKVMIDELLDMIERTEQDHKI